MLPPCGLGLAPTVVRYISDRVTVMYLGRLMEIAPSDSLYERPRHPYTMALLSAALDPDPDVPKSRMLLDGDVPSPMNPPSGCVFRTRCPFALPACAEPEARALREVAPGHSVACIRDDVRVG